MPVVPVQIVPLVVAPGTPREIEDILDVADAANGHYMSNNGLPILVVRNDGVGSINVTVSAHYSQNGLALADLVVAVDAGELKFIGPFTAISVTWPSISCIRTGASAVN